MDDGIDRAGVLDVGEEVIGKQLLVEFSTSKHLGTDKSDEPLAYLLVLGGEPLGFLVAIIDGNAELLPQKVGNVALSAAYSSCYSDGLQGDGY